MKFKVGDLVTPNWEKIEAQGDHFRDKFVWVSWPSKIVRVDLAPGFAPILLLDNEEYVNSMWLLSESEAEGKKTYSNGLDLLKKLW